MFWTLLATSLFNIPILRVIYWALIFVTRLRFPPGDSIADISEYLNRHEFLYLIGSTPHKACFSDCLWCSKAWQLDRYTLMWRGLSWQQMQGWIFDVWRPLIKMWTASKRLTLILKPQKSHLTDHLPDQNIHGPLSNVVPVWVWPYVIILFSALKCPIFRENQRQFILPFYGNQAKFPHLLPSKLRNLPNMVFLSTPRLCYSATRLFDYW